MNKFEKLSEDEYIEAVKENGYALRCVKEQTEEIAKYIAKEKDDYIFNWLEENGYKPQRTTEWISSFKKKLRKQGKFLDFRAVEVDNKFENGIYSTNEIWECSIKNISKDTFKE